MPNNRRLTLALRLEDVVALGFFLLNLAVQIIFSQVRGENLSPADVLIIIPAVALLLAKEVIHYFVSGKKQTARSGDALEFARPYWEIIRDWFPFLIILMMYYSMWGSATHLLVTHDRDAALMAWDQRLFGCQISLVLQKIVSPPLTAWLDFAYAFHLFNIPIVACFIYLLRPRARFREMMLGLIVVSFLGLVGYILVPAIGPMYTLRNQYTVGLHTSISIFNREMQFMDFARVRRDVFPSLHVGISFVVWLYAWRNSKRLFWILMPLILSLWFSTVYLRYHYMIDCIVGFAIAPLSYALANWLYRRAGDIPVSVRLPEAWLEWIRGLGASAGAE